MKKIGYALALASLLTGCAETQMQPQVVNNNMLYFHDGAHPKVLSEGLSGPEVPKAQPKVMPKKVAAQKKVVAQKAVRKVAVKKPHGGPAPAAVSPHAVVDWRHLRYDLHRKDKVAKPQRVAAPKALRTRAPKAAAKTHETVQGLWRTLRYRPKPH